VARRRKQTFPPPRNAPPPPPRPGAGPEPYVRPTVATMNAEAARGQKDLAVGARVRIIGTGLYAGEEAVIESLAGGVIPSAFVRTDDGRSRRVRAIDVERLPARD